MPLLVYRGCLLAPSNTLRMPYVIQNTVPNDKVTARLRFRHIAESPILPHNFRNIPM